MAPRSLMVACLLCLASRAEAQVVRYHHVDAIGSVRALTGAGGAVLERHDYFPFGEECTTGVCADNPVGPAQPRRFTGQPRDAETGLDYFGARYYGSRIARFTSVDPLYTVRENLVDPQRWNRYAYVRNNPLRYVDPDGRKIEFADDRAANEYKAAKVYLGINGSPADNVLDQLEGRNETIKLVVVDSLDREQIRFHNGTIYWNPRAGVRSDKGETQSPAIGLVHEAAHALQWLGEREKFNTDSAGSPKEPAYGNAEDERVLKGPEAAAARAKGEDVRTSHGGWLVRVGAVDERPPKQ